MKFQTKIIVTIFLLLAISNARSQGCSDAGFCSMGNGFKNQEESIKNNIEIGMIYGKGQEDITIFSQYISFTHDLSDKFGLSLKLTSGIANGDLGTNSNLGDAFVSGKYKLNSNSKKVWSALMGFKIPLTNSNDADNQKVLPMAYQSSLGTFDLIAGLNLTYTHWDFNTAVQIPLSQNKNSYFATSSVPGFGSTNLFERKSDALFRATYKFKSNNEKFTFKPNVLLIYHLEEDSFVNSAGMRESIKKSDGLTFNANLITSYKIGSKSYIESSLAAPIITRKAAPDGLKRSFTIGLAYKVNF